MKGNAGQTIQSASGRAGIHVELRIERSTPQLCGCFRPRRRCAKVAPRTRSRGLAPIECSALMVSLAIGMLKQGIKTLRFRSAPALARSRQRREGPPVLLRCWVGAVGLRLTFKGQGQF